MALRTLQHVVISNFEVADDTTIHAGDAVALNTAGKLVLADRGAADAFVGFAYGDNADTGNTMIIPDPVGSNTLTNTTSASNANSSFSSATNGFYVGPKRAIGDFQDESIDNVTNLTASDDPRRGLPVLTTPSTEFVTDRFKLLTTNAATTDAGAVWTPTPGDLCTYGAEAGNEGQLVALGDDTHGTAVARVTRYDATAGLLYVVKL